VGGRGGAGAAPPPLTGVMGFTAWGMAEFHWRGIIRCIGDSVATGFCFFFLRVFSRKEWGW